MEAVEDIPGIALAEGLKWDWESFPEYLDALDGMPRTIDIAAQVPHHPLRVYVMGERAIHLEAATAEDIAAMRAADRGSDEGRRLRLHHLPHQPAQDADRRLVPSRYAEHDELLGIGAALGEAGHGAFGMQPTSRRGDRVLAG